MLRILLILLLLLPAPSWAAIAEIAAKKNTCANYDTIGTCAFAGAVAIGDFLVVLGVSWNGVQNTTLLITDNLSTPTTYTVDLSFSGTSGRTMFIAYGFALAAGTPTVTIDPNGTGNYICNSVDVFSGVHATPLDADGGFLDSTGTAVSQNITTVAANALILGVAANDNTRDFTPGGSYTQIGEDNTGEACNTVYRIATNGTTYAVDWTLDIGGGWTTQLMSFVPAGGVVPGLRMPGLGQIRIPSDGTIKVGN